MFHILSAKNYRMSQKASAFTAGAFFNLVYKSKKLQRFRRRRFPLTKFVFLLTTPLVYFYKNKLLILTKQKVRFFRLFKTVRFGNIQKKSQRLLLQQNNVVLRHLEVNAHVSGFVLLPIPYLYFYSFLLDQTFLWKSVLVELQLYYR